MRLYINKILMKSMYKVLGMLILSNIIQIIGCEEPIVFFDRDIKRAECYRGIDASKQEYFLVSHGAVFNDSYVININMILKDKDNRSKGWERMNLKHVYNNGYDFLLYNKNNGGVFPREYFYEVVITKTNGIEYQDKYRTRAFYIYNDDRYFQFLSDKDYEAYQMPPLDPRYHYSPGEDNLNNLKNLEPKSLNLLSKLRLEKIIDSDSKTIGLKIVGRVKIPIYSSGRSSQIRISLEKMSISKYISYKKKMWSSGFGIDLSENPICKSPSQDTKNESISKDFELIINDHKDAKCYVYRIILTDWDNKEWKDVVITVPMRFANLLKNPRIIRLKYKGPEKNRMQYFIPGIQGKRLHKNRISKPTKI